MKSLIINHNDRETARLTELSVGELDQVSGGDGTAPGFTKCPKGSDITVFGDGTPTRLDC